MPEPVTNPAIGKKREALGCDGGTGHVPAQPFQVLPPAAMDAHVGVERETIGGRATIPGEFDETDSRYPTFPLDKRPALVTQAHRAVYRGRVAPAENRRIERE